MKKIFIILAFLITGFGADAAVPQSQPRGRAQSNASTTETKAATTARAARTRSAARTPVAPTPAASSVATTPGVSTRNTKTIVSTESDKRATGLVSRAAKQSVISTGTKVAAAAQNTVVDEKCWNGFMGCMDSFCMLDNANGGRCICSDKNAEYDSILAEIQSLDEQSYQMATVGVERIEMGDDANAVMKKTQEITKSIEKDSAQSKRKTLDLSAWDVNEIDFDAEVEDIFSLSSDGTGIANKTGDALYRAAAKLCNAQIPECKSQSTMMELMYKQRVRSDCTAYENSLRQQRTQSAQKLATAQSAMREAALEQYRNANKYDLGQCTVQFKQCMQTTGGCGDDFSGCVEYSVRQDLVNGGTDRNEKTIKGTSSKIKLSKATYDVLEAKKELCMSVTQQCVNVRDQVWDTFLREVAPQVKSAELMVESNMRSSCISNISTCFQKACKDNMDPNDPDGSYDMCLTNPDALEGACKVEIDPCKKSVPNIMTYVTARLASMRVDSCTREFKECLTSEDRCGADYTQCVGLDTDTIVEMCPVDKLPGCKYDPSGADDKNYVYKNLEKIATGIFLNIDNNMLSTCQKAVQSKVLEVCGSLSECDAFDDDNLIGTDSLISSTNANGNTVIEGLMNIGALKLKEDNNTYTINYADISNNTKPGIKAAINSIENKALQKVNVLNSDLTITRCISGRGDGWRDWRYKTDTTNNADEKGESQGTDGSFGFPNLLNSYTQMIFNSALDKAKSNYSAKYDEMVAAALKAQSDDEKRMICTAMAYSPDSLECDSEGVCVTKDNGALSDLLEGMYKSNNVGLKDNGYKLEIKQADLTKKLELMSKNKGSIVVKNAYDEMISMVTTEAYYDASSGTCTITTTTTQCETMKENLRETDKVKDKKFENGTQKKYVCDDCKFDTMCAEYAAPIINKTEIKI